jgi:hypothetical protein
MVLLFVVVSVVGDRKNSNGAKIANIKEKIADIKEKATSNNAKWIANIEKASANTAKATRSKPTFANYVIVPEGSWIASAKDIHIEPVLLFEYADDDDDTTGASDCHANGWFKKDDKKKLWRLTAQLKTGRLLPRRRWRSVEITFQENDAFVNNHGDLVLVPLGPWNGTAKCIRSEPLNEERSLWLLKAHLLTSDGKWRAAVTIFRRGELFDNHDGSFVKCGASMTTLPSSKLWRATKKKNKRGELELDIDVNRDDLAINILDFLILLIPPFSVIWGDSIKRRLLNSQAKLKATETELFRTMRAIEEMKCSHEKELSLARSKLERHVASRQ